MESRKPIRVTLITLLIYILLVATHQGEFWPFSIYPMFSQAGKPWTRSLARDVTTVEDSLLWKVTSIDDPLGNPVPIGSYGVDQIDYSNFVSKTRVWNNDRVSALRTMLGEHNFSSQDWMIYKVHGRMVGDDSVTVQLVPWLLFESDTTLFNPNLSREDYFRE